jgi:hypothetical protein
LILSSEIAMTTVAHPISPPTAAALQRVVGQAADLAAQLERGQARLPLREYFLDLAAGVRAGRLAVTLVTLDDTSRRASEVWFQGAAGEPGELPEVASVTLAQLQIEPGLAGQLLSRSDLLVVAGGGGDHPLQGPWDVVRELCEAARFVWPLVLGMGRPRWLATLTGAVRPPSWFVPEELPASGDFGWPAPRACLSAVQQAARLVTALAMFDDRLAKDLRQLDVRRRGLLRRSAALGEGQRERAAREAAGRARQVLDIAIDTLDIRLGEALRERTLPTSARANQIKNLVEDLTVDDLVEEEAAHAVRLRVGPVFLGRVAQAVRVWADEDVTGDLALISERLPVAAADVAATLASGELPPVQLRVPRADETADRDAIIRTVHLDFHQQAESPRRGFFDVIMHGRRPVLLITMALSLGGAAFGAATHLMVAFAPALVVVFGVGLVWSVGQLRRERQERVEAELLRIRLALEGELRRLYEQAVRDWQGQAVRRVREAHRDLARQLDEATRVAAAEAARQTAAERAEVQEKLRLADSRGRELSSLGSQVERLRQAAADVQAAADHALQACLDGPGRAGGW